MAPGIYTINVISEAVYTKSDHEGTIQIEYDDISKKTKIIVTRSGLTFGKLGFNEISFFQCFIRFCTILGLKTY